MDGVHKTHHHFGSKELHTVGGLFCFLDFRLDLCFEPLDFVFFKRGKSVTGEKQWI